MKMFAWWMSTIAVWLRLIWKAATVQGLLHVRTMLETLRSVSCSRYFPICQGTLWGAGGGSLCLCRPFSISTTCYSRIPLETLSGQWNESAYGLLMWETEQFPWLSLLQKLLQPNFPPAPSTLLFSWCLIILSGCWKSPTSSISAAFVLCVFFFHSEGFLCPWLPAGKFNTRMTLSLSRSLLFFSGIAVIARNFVEAQKDGLKII